MIQQGTVIAALPKTYIDLTKLSEAKKNDTKFVNDGITATIDLTDDTITTDNITDRFRVDVQNYWSGFGRDFKKGYGFISKPLSLLETPKVTTPKPSNGPTIHFKSRSLKRDIKMEQVSLTSINTKAYTESRWIATYKVTAPIPLPTEERPGDPNDPTNNVNWWTDWCLGSFSGPADGTSQIDMPFSISTPSRNDKDFTFSGFQRNYVKIRGNYNYMNIAYEELTTGDPWTPEDSSNVIPETLLPNLYTYMMFVEKNQAFKDSNEKIWFGGPYNQALEHIKLYDYISDIDENSLFFQQKKTDAPPYSENKFDLSNNTINNYFSLWTEAAENIDEQSIDLLAESFDTIVFSEADFKIINNYNSAATNFPMNVEIEIETEDPNNLFNALKNTKYNPFMIRYLADTANSEAISFVRSRGMDTQDDLAYEAWDLGTFIAEAKEGISNTEGDYIFIGSQTQEVDFAKSENSFYNMLMSLGLDSKIQNLVDGTFRTYEDIVQGEECYAETVAYEIEKWSSNSEGQVINKLQTFYLPNDDSKIIKMFDTQVKYNKNYVYRIYAHKVVFGTSYSYSIEPDTIIDEASEKSALVDIAIAPHIKIIRIPYYNVNEFMGKYAELEAGTAQLPTHETTIVMDEAPLPPEIEIVPLINEPECVIINLKDTIGSLKQTPRPIYDTDIELYRVLAEKQLKDKFNATKDDLAGIDIFSQNILFKSDEPSEYLEMFHSTQKPTSYYDFATSDRNLLTGPNNSAKIKLNFNQKNYFTFRAIDFHGKFSNPTDVYEVEIKEENGMSFPIFRVLNLEDEAKKKIESFETMIENFTMKGKRFLHIKPTYNQWTMAEKYDPDDFDSPFDIPNFSIGDAEESVFREDRKFKFRLTSKKTGRKIDINLKCKVKQENIHNE